MGPNPRGVQSSLKSRSPRQVKCCQGGESLTGVAPGLGAVYRHNPVTRTSYVPKPLNLEIRKGASDPKPYSRKTLGSPILTVTYIMHTIVAEIAQSHSQPVILATCPTMLLIHSSNSISVQNLVISVNLYLTLYNLYMGCARDCGKFF